MIHRLKSDFWHLFLALVFALASAVNGGAHKISEPIDDATFAYFLEMGGSLDDLCGSAGSQSGLTSSCEVCNLVSAAIISDCTGIPVVSGYVRISLAPFALDTPKLSPSNNGNSIRAPPLAQFQT
jgi:hypothetical protein